MEATATNTDLRSSVLSRVASKPYEVWTPGDFADLGSRGAIDKTLRAFDWTALDGLLKGAGLLRVSRLTAIARETVRDAQERWPALLENAPPAVRATVLERLNGGVALTT